MITLLIAAQLASFPLAAAPATTDKAASASAPDVVLTTMQTELNRAKTDLAKSDPAPYFLSYTVYDQDQILIAASYGGVLTDSTIRRRSADVTMRVGTPQLDNTHGQSRSSGMISGSLPLGEDPEAPGTPVTYRERLEVIASLPGMLADLHHHRIDALTPREPIRKAATPDRNALCPCGSGRKYKKCCGAAAPTSP